MASSTSPQLRQREHPTQSVLQPAPPEMIKTVLPQWRDGRTPVQRNTFYEPIRVLEGAPTAIPQGGAEPPAGKSKVLEDNLASA